MTRARRGKRVLHATDQPITGRTTGRTTAVCGKRVVPYHVLSIDSFKKLTPETDGVFSTRVCVGCRAILAERQRG